MKSKPSPAIFSAGAERVLTESILLPTTGALFASKGVVISNGSLVVTRSHAGDGGGSSTFRLSRAATSVLAVAEVSYWMGCFPA